MNNEEKTREEIMEEAKQRDFYEVEDASGFGSNSLWDDLK